MAQTKLNLDRQAEGRVFSLGDTGAGQEALLTLNKGTAALSTVVLDVKGSATVAGDFNLIGNLNITGAVNSTSVTNTNVADVTITLNDGGTTAAAVGAGINIEGDSGAVVGAIRYSGSGKFTVGDGTTQREIVDLSSAQTLTNKTIGGSQITGNISGNAANITGILGAGSFPALTGDVTTTQGSLATSIAAATVTGKTLTGYTLGTNAAIAAADTILGAFGKVQAQINAKGSGTVTSVSVATANGFTGTVANSGTTPSITLTTSVNGMIKGNGTALSAAVAGTDYSVGTSALGTGILKSTTGTGVLTIATAGDFPILNQNTTGTAANVTGVVAVANGGTGKATHTAGALLVGNGTGNISELVGVTSGHIVTWNGTGFVVQAPAGVSTTFKAVAVSGTQDGANKSFSIASALLANSEQVFLNGQLLNPGGTNDYTISGTTISFTAGFSAPLATDVIRVYGTY